MPLSNSSLDIKFELFYRLRGVRVMHRVIGVDRVAPKTRALTSRHLASCGPRDVLF